MGDRGGAAGSSSTGSSSAAGTSRPWPTTRSGCSSTRSSGTSRTGRSCAGCGRRSTTVPAEWMSSLSGDRRDRADAIAYPLRHGASRTPTHPVPRHAELRHEAARTLCEAAAERAVSIHSHAEAARLWRQAARRCVLPTTSCARACSSSTGRHSRSRTSLRRRSSTRLPHALDRSRRALLRRRGGVDERLAPLTGRQRRTWHAPATSGRSSSCATPPPSHAKALILTRAAHARACGTPRRTPRRSTCSRKHCPSRSSSGLRDIQAEALQFVGLTRLDAGELEGIEDNEKALAIALELNSPVSLSCYGNLADMRRYLRLSRGIRDTPHGRRERCRAVRHPGASASISRRAGDRPLLQRAMGRGAVPARGVSGCRRDRVTAQRSRGGRS